MIRYIHLIAVVASAIVSALTAVGLGGDPVVGASIGAVTSASAAGLSQIIN